MIFSAARPELVEGVSAGSAVKFLKFRRDSISFGQI
jgi:hypothetical protein